MKLPRDVSGAHLVMQREHTEITFLFAAAAALLLLLSGALSLVWFNRTFQAAKSQCARSCTFRLPTRPQSAS